MNHLTYEEVSYKNRSASGTMYLQMEVNGAILEFCDFEEEEDHPIISGDPSKSWFLENKFRWSLEN